MKIILTKDVSRLGSRFDIKDVASGYALNMLIPRGEAIVATPEAVKRIQIQRAKLEGERQVKDDLLAKNLGDLDGMTLRLSGKANEKGHLFAGLHKEEIVKEIQKQTKLELEASFIQIEHPIKEVGEHSIQVKAAGKSAKFKLIVEAA